LGGKWTTYRRMAQDTVDALLSHPRALGAASDPAIAAARARPSVTRCAPLLGAAPTSGAAPHVSGHGPEYQAVEEELRARFALSADQAAHLRANYGLRALAVADVLAQTPALRARLHPSFPFLEAEVVFAARQEMAVRAVDVLARRTRLAFLDADAAQAAAPRVLQLLAAELRWSPQRQDAEARILHQFLDTMRAQAPRA
jgi:glycerol-3-phosphate dehydrogenase